MKLKDFWRWVDKDENGCLIWQRHCNNDGYGIIYVPELEVYLPRNTQGLVQQTKTHRVVWYLHTGEWPDLHVLHECDNPSCVNFDHLFLGTNYDNVQDRVKKGRSGLRDRKLTKEQVQSIAPRMEKGESVRSIARSFGVSHTTVFQILRGETYMRD